jgi:hypothetical protein
MPPLKLSAGWGPGAQASERAAMMGHKPHAALRSPGIANEVSVRQFSRRDASAPKRRDQEPAEGTDKNAA